MSEEVILESEITCPECGHRETETMPTDACQWFYDCKACGALPAAPCSNPKKAIAAYSVPMAVLPVRRSSRAAVSAVSPLAADRLVAPKDALTFSYGF